MAKCFSLLLLLISIWPTRLLAQGSLRVQELSISLPCRIVGVTLVNKKVGLQLNFTEAKEACRLLGLTLASKDQVEEAWKSGFETCNYAWVKEGFSVIPRIIPNPKCGKNGIGVLIWRAPLSKMFGAYCYNSSDVWVNSCFPEVMTTYDPMFDSQSSIHTQFAVSDNTYSASSLDPATSTLATTPAPASTRAPRKRKVICITEVVTETSIVPTETEAYTENKTSIVPTETEAYTENKTTFKNEAAGFGGVPTALLVLALFFFGAAAGLAVCYVKRYVKAFPFTNKNQQKEMIETKVVKEEKADYSSPKEESKKTEKTAEELKSQPKTTVRCLEAEV